MTPINFPDEYGIKKKKPHFELDVDRDNVYDVTEKLEYFKGPDFDSNLWSGYERALKGYDESSGKNKKQVNKK